MSVIVIGAGVAGLAAAATLRRGGIAPVVIEAGFRIGGRAHTTVPPLLGVPFDHGASWLHAAHRNPLAERARRTGEPLIDSDATRIRHTSHKGRPATPAELAEYDAAEAAWNVAADRRLALPGDATLADTAPALPWMPAVLNWEGPVIAAADSAALSLRDWHRNRLDGANLELPGGLGAFIARTLAPPAGPVRLGVAAQAVRWDGTGVAVTTASGTLRAAACIVTASTGVLRAGAIRFTPALPAAVRDALDALPMGTLNKVAFRAAGLDRLGLAACTGIDRSVPAVDDPAMSFIAWPHGSDTLIGFVGGSASAALDREGAPALEAFARAELVRCLGAAAPHALRPGAVATRWSSDPLFGGSYAYAVPGGADARAVLGTPLNGGRLVFAGEATRCDGLAGTVGGAFLAGEEAAEAVLAAVG